MGAIPFPFLLAWIGVPTAALALVLGDLGPFGDLGPGATIRFLQVSLALFAFPFAASEGGLPRALLCALLGAPLTILADRLAGEPAVRLGTALAPLALCAAAAFFGGSPRRPSERRLWCFAWAAVGFGLPWLEYLALDFGSGPAAQLGALSPVLGGGRPSAAASLLAGAVLAGLLRRRR